VNTTLATVEDFKNKKWWLWDVNGKILGRLAVKIANILRGRDKPLYPLHMDAGDFAIVINAEKVKLTGAQETKKISVLFSISVTGKRCSHFSNEKET
jgi:large subunit ribosomal protein L13